MPNRPADDGGDIDPTKRDRRRERQEATEIAKQTVSRLMREFRERSGWTFEEIGDALKVTKQQAKRYNDGDDMPGGLAILLLMDLLRLTNDDLARRLDMPRQPSSGGPLRLAAPDASMDLPILARVDADSTRWQSDAVGSVKFVPRRRVVAGQRLFAFETPDRFVYDFIVNGETVRAEVPRGAIIVVDPHEAEEAGASVAYVDGDARPHPASLALENGVWWVVHPDGARHPRNGVAVCGVIVEVQMPRQR